MDTGLLLARMVLGLLMAAHGAQKLFGWFGGYGLAGTGGFFESLGFRPGRLFAAAAGFTELAGGLLLAFGLLGPLGPAMLIAVMIVAMATVHWQHGLFSQNNGIELPLVYSAPWRRLRSSATASSHSTRLLGLTWPAEVVLTALAWG